MRSIFPAKRLRHGMAAAALSVLWLLPAAAPAPASVFDPEVAMLDNGMQVIVVSKRIAPVVTHMVWYKVGSIDEPQGRSGIAHFLEHLMFKGTEKVPAGRFSEIVAQNGGRDNAFTSYDYTGYFQSIASDRLDLVMELEADRMRNLILDPDQIETERDVVLEERRTRTENSPASRLREQASAAFYRNHPYGRPIIGWEHEIRAITPEDLEAFYDRWYAPDNAVLVVVGDVTMDDVLPLAEKHYGAIPARNVAPPVDWEEPPHRGTQTMELRDQNVREPSWSKRYMAPGFVYGDTEHAYPLEVLSEVLSGGSTSLLYSRLVVEDKVASSAGAWYSGSGRGPGSFGFYVAPAQGRSLEEASAAMEEEIAKLLKSGVSEDDVRRAIIRLQDSAEFAKDSFSGIARAFGAAITTGQTVEDVEAWPERIGQVTVDQVNAALRHVLETDSAMITRLLPTEGERS